MCSFTFTSLNLDNKLLNVSQALMHIKLFWLGFKYLMNFFVLFCTFTVQGCCPSSKKGRSPTSSPCSSRAWRPVCLTLSLFTFSENWCIENFSWEWTLSPLFYQLLKIRRISCPREARTPSLPKIGKENVSFHVTFIIPELI